MLAFGSEKEMLIGAELSLWDVCDKGKHCRQKRNYTYFWFLVSSTFSDGHLMRQKADEFINVCLLICTQNKYNKIRFDSIVGSYYCNFGNVKIYK